MPIVVDPGFAWPPETDPVVSPDGKLTAIVDPAHAGVLLRADFDDSVADTPAVPEKVLRRNLAVNPSFASSQRQEGGDAIFSGASATVDIDSSWSSSGGTSLKVIPNGASTGSYCWMYGYTGIPNHPHAGKTITVAIDVRLDTAQAGSTHPDARKLAIGYDDASGRTLTFATTNQIPNQPGTGRAIATFTLPTNITGWVIRGINGSLNTPVWFDNLTIEIGASEGTYFDGSTGAAGTKRYRWTGAADNSASEEYTPATPFIPGKPGTVAKVRFERQDGTVVRSGNPAWAPGGYAHAYDHEATLGGGTLWRAVPIRFDGTEGEPSEYVGAVIPALTDGWAWLKPVTDPDKAMLLKVEPPDLSYDGRVDTTSIAGAPRPAATWDVLEGFTTQLRSLVREKDVEEQLKALLDEGPVLAQFPACAGLPDFYFIRGKLDLEHVHWDGWPWRRYQWDVTQIDRPDTTDSPLRIPGLSYDTVERDWTTYDQLAATVESYNKLLEP